MSPTIAIILSGVVKAGIDILRDNTGKTWLESFIDSMFNSVQMILEKEISPEEKVLRDEYAEQVAAIFNKKDTEIV